MNQTQIKYARERAASIHAQRKQAIVDKYTVPAVELDVADKLAALKSGAFKVTKPSGSYRWYDSVVFNDESRKCVNKAKIDAETVVLGAAYRAVIDELVLGDNEEALRLLKAFEAA